METRINNKDCPLEYAVSILGGKWKIKLIWTIYKYETIRFNQLKRELPGITDLMLTKILKSLVSEKIVKRESFNEVPPHVEYSLTDNGLKLIEALSGIRQWIKDQSSLQPFGPQVIPLSSSTVSSSSTDSIASLST